MTTTPAASPRPGRGLFHNPVLRKELRVRLRARKQPRAARVTGFWLVALIVGYLYYSVLRSLIGGSGNEANDIYILLTLAVQMTLLLFLTPALSAGSITMEREQQTWNALLLSRLSAREIVWGKFVACLLPATVLLAVFAPLGLLAALQGSVPLTAYLLSNTMLMTTALFYTALGLFWSWKERRTYQATAAAFGTVAFLVVGMMILFVLWGISMNGNGPGTEPETFVPLWLNPYMSLWMTLDGRERNYIPALANITFCLLGTLSILAAVTRRLTHGPGELEQ